MEKTDIKITRFKDGDWFIDIVETDELYESWLQHKDYGVSSLMFGLMKKDVSFACACEAVKANIDNHKAIYKEAHMDEE